MTKLTLERVAELAGVSRSTASRAINGQDGVRPEIRRRVLDVVEITGFVPHAAARSLAGQRSNILGLAIRQTTEQVFSDPFFAGLVQGISGACNAQDQTLSLFLLQSADGEDRLPVRMLRTKLVDGLIVTATFTDDPLVWQLSESGIPFVMVGEAGQPDLSSVEADNDGGAALAARHLLELGRRHMATVTGPLRNSAAARRLLGFERALAAEGVPLDPRLVAEADFTEEGAYAATVQLLDGAPDAIFAASDRMGVGVMRAVKDAGLHVPDDVAVIGFDDLSPALETEPQLTTVRQEVAQLGTVAVDLLLERVRTPEVPPRRVELPTTLVVRGSTVPTAQREVLVR